MPFSVFIGYGTVTFRLLYFQPKYVLKIYQSILDEHDFCYDWCPRRALKNETVSVIHIDPKRTHKKA